MPESASAIGLIVQIMKTRQRLGHAPSLTTNHASGGRRRTPFRCRVRKTEWRRSAAANAGGDAMHALAEPPVSSPVSPTVGAYALPLPTRSTPRRHSPPRRRDDPRRRRPLLRGRARARAEDDREAGGAGGRVADARAIASSTRTRSSRSTSSAGQLSSPASAAWPTVRAPCGPQWSRADSQGMVRKLVRVRPAPGLSGSISRSCSYSSSAARWPASPTWTTRRAATRAATRRRTLRFSATAAAEQLGQPRRAAEGDRRRAGRESPDRAESSTIRRAARSRSRASAAPTRAISTSSGPTEPWPARPGS